jgi:flagellar assembly protein FliH
MSTNRTPLGNPLANPVFSFQYRQTSTAASERAEDEVAREPEITMTESDFRARLASERTAAVSELERQLHETYERKHQAEMRRISDAIAGFEQTKKDYFARVEMEIVQLALAIASKIIHREAQSDPLLVAAIVQIALGQFKEGSAAVLRVQPEEVSRWHGHFDALGLSKTCTLQADAELKPGDCVLETEIGSVNFSLDAQLKEIERGFFDVLAHRPQL